MSGSDESDLRASKGVEHRRQMLRGADAASQRAARTRIAAGTASRAANLAIGTRRGSIGAVQQKMKLILLQLLLLLEQELLLLLVQLGLFRLLGLVRKRRLSKQRIS